MKQLSILFFIVAISLCKAQSWQSLDTIKAPANLENVSSRTLYSDSLVSSFVIFIKKEVKEHKHVSHTEHVYVLEGEGEMSLGEKKFPVKKGDMIFIPKGTIHSLKVTSATPMKVISVQAPMFDGKDRVMNGQK
ncbi:MAG TPA: cupin domain-containing protein [Bacteroidia bacterium]